MSRPTTIAHLTQHDCCLRDDPVVGSAHAILPFFLLASWLCHRLWRSEAPRADLPTLPWAVPRDSARRDEKKRSGHMKARPLNVGRCSGHWLQRASFWSKVLLDWVSLRLDSPCTVPASLESQLTLVRWPRPLHQVDRSHSARSLRRLRASCRDRRRVSFFLNCPRGDQVRRSRPRKSGPDGDGSVSGPHWALPRTVSHGNPVLCSSCSWYLAYAREPRACVVVI